MSVVTFFRFYWPLSVRRRNRTIFLNDLEPLRLPFLR